MKEGTIRQAQRGDELAIYQLIKDLATFEKAPNEVTNTTEELAKHLFDEKICEAIVYELENEIVGFALYYISYSTWKGVCLYLEDFYVKPSTRGLGVGSKLFDEVVEIAKAKKVKRMDWQVLDWNESAIEFYKHKNAILDSEWVNGRIYLS
jgi:ribosomal protein S18 acetylase RimI-like enzyme